MTDPRIRRLLEAAQAMRQGDFGIDVPIDEFDDVGELSLALLDLSHTLDRRFTELRAVARVAERVSAGLVLDQVCSQVYETFQGLIPYDRIGLALLEDGGRTLRARWARSEAGEIQLDVGFSAPMAGSSLQRIIETGQPRIINDLPAYLETRPESRSTQLVVAEGVRSSLTCPLVTEDGPVGFLFFSSFQVATYQDAHVELYQAIAAQLSVIVAKSRMYEELVALDAFRSRMLGMVAHDLRNPLTLLLTTLEILEDGDGGALNDTGQTLVRQASRASERMVALLEDLLDVSAIEVGHLTLTARRLDLGPWLRALVDEQAVLAARKETRLALSLPERPVVLSCDPDRLSQVVVNLIGNAVKYAPGGSEVRVALTVEGDGASIAVSDQGPGIEADEIERVFEPFEKTRNKPTGGESSTGLGLAISKRIVEAHGGQLTVQSHPGDGSTFRMWVPGVEFPSS